MSRNSAETAQVANAVNPGISVQKGSDLRERRISVAPMMDWTDRHCRYFLRGFSPRVLLYTEMITAAAITRGNSARLLRYSGKSSRWRCSWAAVILRSWRPLPAPAPRAVTARSISTAAVPAIGCMPGPSAPA